MKKVEIGRWNIDWLASFEAARSRINEMGISMSLFFEEEENQCVIYSTGGQQEKWMITLGMFAAKHYWDNKD